MHKRINKIFDYLIIFIIMFCITYKGTEWLIRDKRPTDNYTYKEIVISEGDRLWNIAKIEIENNEYYKNADIRQVTYDITNDNKIKGTIYPGQIIKIRIIKDESSPTNQSLDNSSVKD